MNPSNHPAHPAKRKTPSSANRTGQESNEKKNLISISRRVKFIDFLIRVEIKQEAQETTHSAACQRCRERMERPLTAEEAKPRFAALHAALNGKEGAR
ncbi:MAG: hypothetical protein NTZ46_11780 [Verrucomicrobia bacterium]|nr:hypothetical protein [Verrucomicrobiota bacterium]